MNETEIVQVSKDFILSFNVAKTENGGEDADPVFLNKGNYYFLSVCDGMGGAGSTNYVDNGIQKSGAYIASRLVNEQAQLFFDEIISSGLTFGENDLPQLKSTIIKQLKLKLHELKKDEEGKLKSRLLKDLPTTFSGIFFKKEKDLKFFNVFSIWAGDSRNYLFTSDKGLQQLSVDDLKQRYDPLENLTKDSPLNNIISAEGNFEIRLKRITGFLPCILFTATDGCYGYFNSPMQFEYVLLNSLSNSDNVDEWKENLKTEIGTVAGDDYSMSLIALGYGDFSALKNVFSRRHEEMYRSYITDLVKQEQSLQALNDKKLSIELEIKTNEEKRNEMQKQVWSNYKEEYLKFIS